MRVVLASCRVVDNTIDYSVNSIASFNACSVNSLELAQLGKHSGFLHEHLSQMSIDADPGVIQSGRDHTDSVVFFGEFLRQCETLPAVSRTAGEVRTASRHSVKRLGHPFADHSHVVQRARRKVDKEIPVDLILVVQRPARWVIGVLYVSTICRGGSRALAECACQTEELAIHAGYLSGESTTTLTLETAIPSRERQSHRYVSRVVQTGMADCDFDITEMETVQWSRIGRWVKRDLD